MIKTGLISLAILISTVSSIAQSTLEKEVDVSDLIRVIRNEKVGFVTKDEKIIIPFQYDIGDEDDILDKTAEFSFFLNPEDFQSYGYYFRKDTLFTNRYYQEALPVKIKGKYGYINVRNEILIPFEYEDADRFRSLENISFAIVKKNGKYGVIDINNKVLIDFVYDELLFIPNLEYYHDHQQQEKGFDCFYAVKDDYSTQINLKEKRICVIHEGQYGINNYLCSED
jgi:hypothetical protein